eukprot:CAMPEP_0115888016 /NCGR_PEP_ID=MMETSP0287-20121206/32082_1 /TAXON_ID=412157 /ORGANISM="Chrysochromulina rotalis, Strain UIO044" /LENGTH=42 /DNA_ID= /DNA_START= /DNA_END= /DNA_ORIENTATION=
MSDAASVQPKAHVSRHAERGHISLPPEPCVPRPVKGEGVKAS